MMHLTLELPRRLEPIIIILFIYNGPNSEDIEICCMQHKDHSKSSTLVIVPISTTKPLTNG